MDVEKTYWALKGSGKFDLETFQQQISPPLPKELIPGMYYVCVHDPVLVGGGHGPH